MSVDPKVYELAKLYLEDEPDLNTESAWSTLADAIQQAIEDELMFMRAVMEKAA